jgi:type I restriction enzyme S subunit
LKSIKVLLPPLTEQKAIAEVLSSLDDKIDLLTRQNKTLEDIAQAYFRKWFIEDASDEWEIKKLRDFGEIICGKTPPTTNKKFFNGNIPFIKIPDMHNNVYIFDTADTLSEMGAKYQENKFIPPMSICVSCIATVGLVSMNVFLSQTNQQINSLIPKHDKYRYYLFLFLRSYRDELLALGSGGTMTLNINKTLFGDIECYCPDDEILFRFNNVVNPLFGKIYNNCKQIRILSKLRNTLLPKLISGEIRVKM